MLRLPLLLILILPSLTLCAQDEPARPATTRSAYWREVDQQRVERAAELIFSDLRQVEAELGAYRQEVRKQTGRLDIEGSRAAVAALEQEMQKLTIDLTGQKARQEAILIATQKLTAEAEEKVRQDPIADQLAQIVEIREGALQNARELAQTGRVSRAEVAAAEAQLAESRARWLERKELAGRGAGGDLLAELNRQMLMLSIDIAELEGRRNLVQDLVARFHGISNVLDRFEQLQARRSRLQHELLDIEATLRRHR